VAQRRGLRPLARLVAYAFAGVDPQVHGHGSSPAVRAVLDRAGLRIQDLDVIELNEAFAAQALGVAANWICPPTARIQTAAALGSVILSARRVRF